MNLYRTVAEELVKVTPLPPLEQRCRSIENLNENCYQDMGRFLAPDILEMLGEWLLAEYHANPNPHKARLEEYPVLSKDQLKRRKRKTVLVSEETALSTLAYHIQNNSTIRKDKAYSNDN